MDNFKRNNTEFAAQASAVAAANGAASSSDYREGVAAFLEKRKPKWSM